MSTWHQDRHPAPLWHPTKWTVVNDKLGQLTTVARFDDRVEAETHATNTGGYVIPPT